MFAKHLFFVLGLTFLFTNVACQKSGGGDNQTNDTIHPLYVGDLDKKMNEIYGKENENMMDVCDKQWRPRILEISRVLEEKRKDIEALASKNNSNNNVAVTEFGSFKFINDIDHAPGANEWQIMAASWSKIANLYENVKNDSSNPSWVTLNRLARSMVLDDENRIVRGSFYGLTKDSGPMIQSIANLVGACVSIPSCIQVPLTNDQQKFLGGNLVFKYYMTVLRSTRYDAAKKREVLAQFLLKAQGGVARYGFMKNSLIRVEDKTLVIPLDLSVLGDGAAKFIELNEKAWNVDPEYAVKIEAVTDPAKPSYKILVDDEQGGRAFVNTGKKIMQLYNWGRVKTFTHEFGHIIGFKDNYYTTWDTTTCAYAYQSNAGDLMSDSTDGVVLTSHWDQLRKVYFSGAQ